MSKLLTKDEHEQLLQELAAILDECRVQGRTLTYLQIADALAIEAPQRIHKTTRLLEKMLKHDAEAGRPIRAALAVSRTRGGRPAPGFFERARRLGLFDGTRPERFHDQLLHQLFERPADTSQNHR